MNLPCLPSKSRFLFPVLVWYLSSSHTTYRLYPGNESYLFLNNNTAAAAGAVMKSGFLLITDLVFSGLNNHSCLKYYFHTYFSLLVLTLHFAKSTCHVFPHQIQMSSWSGLCNLILSFQCSSKHHHKFTLSSLSLSNAETPLPLLKFPLNSTSFPCCNNR